tara:strand:- start:11710 stop:11949 length:240 start_codon:yes stop_codon:yes gene_type:complete
LVDGERTATRTRWEEKSTVIPVEFERHKGGVELRRRMPQYSELEGEYDYALKLRQLSASISYILINVISVVMLKETHAT